MQTVSGQVISRDPDQIYTPPFTTNGLYPNKFIIIKIIINLRYPMLDIVRRKQPNIIASKYSRQLRNGSAVTST